MDGPDGSFDNLCNYSSSLEDLLTNARIARQDDFSDSQSSPQSSDPLPTPDVPGIVICSVPTTQNSNPEGKSQVEEFSTPPEEARTSSSEEPLLQRPNIDSANPLNANDREREETVADDADSRGLGEIKSDCSIGIEGNSKLGFLTKMTSKIVELGSSGKVLVGNVCGVKIQLVGDNKSGNTPEKKISAEPPRKKAKVADNCSGLSTPNVPVETRLNSSGKAKKVIPLSFISPEKGKRVHVHAPCLGGGDRSYQEKGEGGEPSLNDKGLVFPPAEVDSDVNQGIIGARTDKVSDDPSQVKKSVLEVLAILASRSRKDMVIDEDIDILETAKMRGMVFPRPSWW